MEYQVDLVNIGYRSSVMGYDARIEARLSKFVARKFFDCIIFSSFENRPSNIDTSFVTANRITSF